MAEPTKEELLARIAELEKQTAGRKKGTLEFRVGEKGGVSVYGLGRFPVTLYYEQWIRLLDASRISTPSSRKTNTASSSKISREFSQWVSFAAHGNSIFPSFRTESAK